MTKVIKSFEPIIDRNSRVLILGTMPGPKSLREKQYYANPRNQFWKIIYRILNRSEAPPSDYNERIRFLIEHGIALWDVPESCEREGASDSKIKNGTLNDLETQVLKYPRLRGLFFNGKKAEECFKKHECPGHVECLSLPSTSPANARMTLEDKIRCWSVLKDFL